MWARRLLSFISIVDICLSISMPVSAAVDDIDLNARFAPGADGQSVELGVSYRVPTSHTSIFNSIGGVSTLRPYYFTSYYVASPAESKQCDPNSVTIITNGESAIDYGDPIEGGILKSGALIDRATGKVLKNYIYCWIPTRQIPQGALPPTYEQIWNKVFSGDFVTATKNSGAFVAPQSPGLTGLPTRIWAQFPQGQTIARDVTFPGGYRIITSAKIKQVLLTFTTPGGRREVISKLDAPGSAGIVETSFWDPVAIHSFRTAGTHQLTTEIMWTADSAELSGPGIPTRTVPLGSVRLEINRTYIVNELRPGLVE